MQETARPFHLNQLCYNAGCLLESFAIWGDHALKRLRAYLIAALLSCLVLGFALPAPADSRGISVTTKTGKPVKLYKDYAALVIGISDYRYWPKLPGAIRDAKEVAAALQAKGFKVKLVQNPDSDTLKDILNRLPYNQGKPKDRALLIYFAGHGATESLADGAKMGYIVPKDCPLPTVDAAGFAGLGISMRRFEDLALRVKCRHVLMAFDSCFSGSLFALGRVAPRDISEKVSRPVRQFVTAGNENEEVPDQSTFKQVFIDGVGGEADYDRDGYVTGSELGMYLQKEVVNYTRGAQHPQYGKIRNPKLDKGDFVFLLAGGPGTTPAVKPTPPAPAPPTAPDEDRLKALEEEAKRREAWSKWQERMNGYWARTEKLERRSLPPTKKAEAWKEALRSFQDDNPFSSEDESLRSYAKTRVKHWEGEATASARAAKEAKAKAKAEATRREKERKESAARRKREAAGGGKRFTNSIGMAFVKIPAGSFMMGSSDADLARMKKDFEQASGKWQDSWNKFLKWEQPPHRVEISRPFYLQSTEVTNSQFARFVKATGYKTEAETGGGGWVKTKKGKYERTKGADWRHPFGPDSSISGKERHPVLQVSWNDAQAFIKWLKRTQGKGYRLPSEAEWEYACRGGKAGENYSWGDKLPSSRKVANLTDRSYARKYPGFYHVKNYDDGYAETAPTASFEPNGFGLYDMLGNVWEWCSDWFDQNYYNNSPIRDPKGPGSGKYRVVRGGSWGSDPWFTRSASRSRFVPRVRSNFTGFRVAKDY